jgi:phosphonoacetaldehyde hydrolase
MPASLIKAFVFDWAGTMVDFGSLAPVRALQNVFAVEGIDLTTSEARADMGMAKRAHITAILSRDPMRAQWQTIKGTAPVEADVARLFEAVGPMMQQAAADCATLIPGAAELAALLRSKGIRILPRAEAQGYAPELVVCAGETAEGRPSPLMTWKALVELGVWPARACVKVDDATVGIVEGNEAGVWTIGVAASGNGVGLDAAAFAALSPEDRKTRVDVSAEGLKQAGADYVVASVADIAALLPELEARIAANERPGQPARIRL